MTIVHQNPCATCGACCRSYFVPVCGYDVWRICTRQHLSAEDFVIVIPDAKTKGDSFRLSRDGPHYSLALDKQGRFRSTGPCIFLVHLAGGHDRCGIYADRPVVCQSYPMRLRNGAVNERDDRLCPPNSWPAETLLRPHWRTALNRLKIHFDVYHEVVARWNAWIATIPANREYSPSHYFDYLLNVYDRLAAVDREIDDDTLQQIHEGWGKLPGEVKPGAKIRVAPGELPWLEYYRRTRQTIDRFFEEVPPLSITLPITRD